MALVEHLKRRLAVSRLRRAARRAPSPASYGTLAERLIALGETGEALRVAEEGLELFPEAERLLHVRVFAKKDRLCGQIRRLREELARRPSPLTYAQLAQSYRELGSHDEALAMTAECAERFPLNEAGFLVAGEIRAERFRKDLVARDAVLADEALTKVVRLNSQNVAAHLLLAELDWLVGARAACRAHLGRVTALMPSAADVQAFLDDLNAAAVPEEESAPAFDVLAEAVEQQRAFAGDPTRFPDPAARAAAGAAQQEARVDAGAVRSAMAALGANAGVRNAVLLDKDGAAVAEFAAVGALATPRFVELVQGVRDVADDAGRRMDAGALVRVEIEGPGGNVAVARPRGLTVGVLYGGPMRADAASAALDEFVARTLAPQRGEARA